MRLEQEKLVQEEREQGKLMVDGSRKNEQGDYTNFKSYFRILPDVGLVLGWRLMDLLKQCLADVEESYTEEDVPKEVH